MKNKKTLYILLPLVLVIWGTILFKIFNKSSATDNPLLNTTIGTDDFYIEKEDSFSLSMNYKDPFLKNTVAEIKKPAVTITKRTTPSPPREKIITPWPTIIYNGLMKKSGSGKVLAFIQIGGKGFSLMENDLSMGVKILKLYKDSVQVQFNGEKRVIRK